MSLISEVAEYDTSQAAADAMNVSRTTLLDRMRRESANYSEILERSRSARKASGKEEAKKSEKARIKELEKLVDLQKQQIEDMRGARRFSFPAGSRSDSGGQCLRVIIPDSHGSAIDPNAASAFLADLEMLKPAEIVMLGDHIDCGGFLAEHHPFGYLDQTEYSFAEDCDAANTFLDSVMSLSECRSIHYLEGNHERRIESWIVKKTLQNKEDAKYLHSIFSVPKCLHIEKRGIEYHRMADLQESLNIGGTIKIGHCYFSHGTKINKHAAASTAERFGACIVFGHTHRADSYMMRNVHSGIYGAWNPGCLCKLQPLWRNCDPTVWSHGYAVQVVNPDGTFLHLNIPIIDGKSYMLPLSVN